MRKILHTILATVLLISCSETYDESLGLYPTLTPRYLAISTSSLNFQSAKSAQDIDVTSAQTPWKFENTIDWISVTPMSGNANSTVNIGVAENVRGDEPRTSIFYLKSDVADWKFESPVSVTQAGATPTISISKEQIDFTGTTNRETIIVSANCQYEVSSGSNWITTVQTDDNIEISVTPNETQSYRKGYVYVSHRGASNVSKTITIQQALASINASTESLVFNNAASQVEITITAESGWTASTSNSWIEISPTSGNAGTSTMKVSVSPNTSTSERNGYIVLYIGGNQCVQIPVRQRGIFIEVENNQMTFDAGGGSQTMSILSNTTWTISSCPDWITVDKSNGEGNTSVKLTAADNPNTTSRSGKLHITQQGISIDCVVDITQHGKTFDVTSTVLNFEDKKASQTIAIESNGTWYASTSDSWITVDPSNATGNGNLTVSVEENTTNNERIGAVSVRLGDKTTTVNVVQKGKYFTVDDAMLTYTSKGGNINISVSTNDSWTAKVEDAPAWLKLSATSGTGSMNITATAEDNPSVNSRSATIVLETVNHQSIRVLVTQNARYLNVDTRKILFYFKGGDSEPITISTDGTYKLTSSASWFTTTVTDNKLVVTASENSTTEPRIGTIKIELTDLKEGTYSLILDVTQLNYGGSFLRQGYGEDVNYDSEGATSGNLTITGFGNDSNWDTTASSSTSLSVSSYSTDKNWDSNTSSSVTVSITGYSSDKNHDANTSPSGSVSKTEFGNDQNWQ